MATMVYLPAARQDVADLATGYSARAAGLGNRFMSALKATSDRIQGNPWTYGEIAPGVRAGTIRKFPQVVYYSVLDDGVVLVLAVRHGREDPAVWQKRI